MTNTTRQISDFFAQLSDAHQTITLFEHVPDVYFFVKDRQSRLITCNQAMLRLFNRKRVCEIHGRTGLDFFPASIASAFLEDDQRVMENNEPLIDAVELNIAADGHISWFCTTKLPLFDKSNTIIGLMGITRNLGTADRRLHPGARMVPVIEHMQHHLDQEIEIPTLARLCRLSVSQFHRSFKALFRQTPLQFILKLRIQLACQMLLSGDANVGEIADKVGFDDQNYLTRQFKAVTGITPTAYRKKYRSR